MQTVFLPSEPFAEKTVVAIGFFDGVHLAHRALLSETVRLAREAGAKAALFTFDTLPVKAGAPLSTLEERLTLFEGLGIEVAFVARFSDVCSLSPKDFVKNVLMIACGATRAVCGFNFRFGKGACGSASDLLDLLPESRVLSEVELGGVTVSSTRVRALLSEGKVAEANALLGAPYTVSAEVEHGKALGRTLGFPTLNMRPASLPLADGVYETRVCLDGTIYAGVTDVGYRPTVEGEGERRMETHLIGFDGCLYGKTLAVSFVGRLRDEIAFKNERELAHQLAKDKALAERNFKNERDAK